MTLKQNKWIVFPDSVDSIEQSIQDHYSTTLGFPGCIGSIDCVHFFWNCCRGCWSTHSMQEKREQGTNSFLSSKSWFHIHRNVLSVSNAGCDNDKTIARFDAAIANLWNQASIWSKSVWEYYYKQNETVGIEKGFYFICDGGYHSWPHQLLIAP